MDLETVHKSVSQGGREGAKRGGEGSMVGR